MVMRMVREHNDSPETTQRTVETDTEGETSHRDETPLRISTDDSEDNVTDLVG
jgi:hypothetical protein